MRLIGLLSILFPLHAMAYVACPAGCSIPQSQVGQSVPFTNRQINPNQTIVFPYNFGAYATIVCYTPDFTPNYLVSYTHNNCIMPCTQLPVILTTIPNVANTVLADKVGRVGIKNTSNQAIYVSCEYGF